MNCVVEQIDPVRWDQFVYGQIGGTFFHLWRWREVLSHSFGYKPVYLAVEEHGELHGILPLFLVRSLLFGKSAVTIPLGVYGGPVATSAEVETMLIEKAQEIARPSSQIFRNSRQSLSSWRAIEYAFGSK
jgi:hypothetical protein